MTQTRTTELPDGYEVFEDGKDRWVLAHKSWDHGEMFTTKEQAAERAYWLEV